MKVYRNFADAVDDYGREVRENRARRMILCVCAIVFLMAFLLRCSDESEPKKTKPGVAPVEIVVTDDTPGIIIDEPVATDPPIAPIKPDDPVQPETWPEPVHNPPVLALIGNSGNSLYFYDTDAHLWQSGAKVNRIKSKVYAYGDRVYYFTNTGAVDRYDNIGHVPDYIRLAGSDIWTARNLTAEELTDNHLPSPHVEIKKNNIRQGWFQSYTAVDLREINGDIFCLGNTGGWRHLNGSKTAINTVDESGFLVYDFAVSTGANINGTAVTWSFNYNAHDWINTGSEWIAGNDYRLNELTVTRDTTLTAYRTKIMLKLGMHSGKAYWILCNTGRIVELNPANNQVTELAQLYTGGDGSTAFGNTMKLSLQAVLVDGKIYFKDSGGDYYRHNLDTGTTAHFVTGMSKVWGF